MKGTRAHRADISLALIHLTGDRGERKAIDALVSILAEGFVRPSGHDGYVKGTTPAACFTEMPLSSVPRLVSESLATKHQYFGYGVAIHKHYAFRGGARPVLYLPDAEAGWIPEEHRWRHVRFEHGNVDFTHEREWRAPGGVALTDFNFYVLVGTRSCERYIRERVPEERLARVLGFIHLNTLVDFL